MRVIFLDYDGVVNTPQWSVCDGKWVCRFNFPFDDKVNDEQAVQWVSEFCEKYEYAIVISSTWRLHENFKECLTNAGLRDGIEILGRTPYLKSGCRGDEIQEWLNAHPEVESFIILDDDNDMGKLQDHLVLCPPSTGFKADEFDKAEELHKKYQSLLEI